MNESERLVTRLLEAPIDTGDYADFIHPEKREKMAKRSHPMAKNPAYPEYTPQAGSKTTNWEELLASEQYQATLKRLTKFLADVDPRRKDAQGNPRPIRQGEIGSILQGMLMAVMQAMAIEEPHKEQLEQMAIDLIFEQPEFRKLKASYDNGDFTIDAHLGPANLENARLSPEQGGPGEPEEEPGEEGEEMALPGAGEEGDVEREEQAMGELGQFDMELAKRKVINAMIHGGAVSKNYAYQLVSQELGRIDPKLVGLYGLAMAGSELGYFATPDSMAAMALENPELQGGSSEVNFEEGGEEGKEKPVVRARGLIFPMLVQELAKGLLELVSYEGLPQDPQMAQDVIDKADLVDQESWAMIMGRGLWTRFVNALGGDEDEITMHLYNRIVQMPPEEFNRIMQAIQGGGTKATEVIKRLAQDLRMDMEVQDRSESGFGSSEPEEPEYPEGEEPWR